MTETEQHEAPVVTEPEVTERGLERTEPDLPEIDLPEGWVLVHHAPEEVVVTNETQGHSLLMPNVLRAEKQINGSLVNAEADSEELLVQRIEAIDQNVEAFHSDPEAAPAAEEIVVTRATLDSDGNVEPEEIEVNLNTVVTDEGTFTEEEWAGRARNDTVIADPDEGQVVFSGVGENVEAIDEQLGATATATAEGEIEATTDPHAAIESKQIIYDTADAIDSPGQSAGGTLIIPAEADDLAGAAEVMSALSQDVENERVAPSAEEEETSEESGDEEADGEEAEDEEDEEDGSPEATPAAQETADELGVDLADVEGTGKEGKITKSDVEAHAAGSDA